MEVCMKKSFIGAGALALAIALAGCGGAPAAPAAGTTGDSAATGATTPAASGDTTSGGATSATAASGGATTGGTIATTANTVIDAAMADPRFSTLTSLLEATGLSQTLAEAGPMTVFAPTNEAFAALPAGTLEALAQDPALLQQILLYHVAEGELRSTAISSETSAATEAGAPIEISASGTTITLNGTAQIIQPDITVGNGVIHVIDQVLLPPNVSLPNAG